MKEKIKAVLKEIRPLLQADGGDVEFVDVTDDGILRVRLQGSCVTCRDSIMTLKQGIERVVMEQVPEVKEVIPV